MVKLPPVFLLLLKKIEKNSVWLSWSKYGQHTFLGSKRHDCQDCRSMPARRETLSSDPPRILLLKPGPLHTREGGLHLHTHAQTDRPCGVAVPRRSHHDRRGGTFGVSRPPPRGVDSSSWLVKIRRAEPVQKKTSSRGNAHEMRKGFDGSVTTSRRRTRNGQCTSNVGTSRAKIIPKLTMTQHGEKVNGGDLTCMHLTHPNGTLPG